LLKTALKKLKKCDIDAKTAEIAKTCLNLDYSTKAANMKKLDDICCNFVAEVDEIRK